MRCASVSGPALNWGLHLGGKLLAELSDDELIRREGERIILERGERNVTDRIEII